MSQTPYGLPPAEHSMKIHPWTVRLQAATNALTGAIKTKNRSGMVKGIEDTSFWTGRIICDGIGAESTALNQSAKFQQAIKAIVAAQKAILEAKRALHPANYSGLPTKPSLAISVVAPACLLAIIALARSKG